MIEHKTRCHDRYKVDYDYSAAIAYGNIRADREKKGQIVGNMDMQIAGQALSLDMTVVTNNTKEFERVIGLELDNWVSLYL